MAADRATVCHLRNLIQTGIAPFSDPPAKAVQSEPRDGEAVLLRDGELAPRRSQLHRHSHVSRFCGEAGRRLGGEVAVVERCLWLRGAVFSIEAESSR